MGSTAYFISFHTYGTWLHGHPEGSVDREHDVPGKVFAAPCPPREAWMSGALRQPRVELDAERRFVVDATIRDVCQHRGWPLGALHVRSTHVHAVLSALHTPERVMNDLKAWSTRRLRESGVLPPTVQPWSHHGSTRYLNTNASFSRAVHYVLHEQGPPLEMRCPPGWRCEKEPRRTHEPGAPNEPGA